MTNPLRRFALPTVFVLAAFAAACGSTVSSSTNASTSSTLSESTSSSATATSALTTHPAFGTCPSAAFPDLSGTSAGENYASPNVTVSCSDSTITVTSNNMISYPFVKTTPNALAPQNYKWTIPLSPTRAASTTSIVNRLGTLGFTVTGLAIYGPTEAAQPVDEAFGDPVYNGLLDSCGGHTAPGSAYHYHTIIYTDAACNFETSQLVGYAIDGFPIYNSVICLDASCTSTTMATSGYSKIGDPKTNVWNAYTYSGGSGDGVLDACNGRVEADGTYAYHLTPTQFPYIIGCFVGSAAAQTGNAAAAMPAMR